MRTGQNENGFLNIYEQMFLGNLTKSSVVDCLGSKVFSKGIDTFERGIPLSSPSRNPSKCRHGLLLPSTEPEENLTSS